jgi:tricorn protease
VEARRAHRGRRPHQRLQSESEGVARGDVFTAPIEKGPTRNLTRSSGAHDKWARWSPDGSQVAFLSDRTGEEELYLVAQDGAGELVQLTDNGGEMRYAPAWSPDGERIAFSDKRGKLFVVDVSSREIVEVADDPEGRIFDHTWSPNGGHLAFSMSIVNDWNVGNGFSSIHIWSVADGETRKITTDMFNEVEPVWDPSGDYLYYLADRTYAPQISTVEWNFATDRSTSIFALALRAEVEHPFGPESDEVSVGDEDAVTRTRVLRTARRNCRVSSPSISRAWPTASPACRSRRTTSPV